MDKLEIVKTSGKVFLRSLIFLTSIIGTLGIYNFVAGNYYNNPDVMFSVGGTYSFVENIRMKFQSVDYFEEKADKISTNCTSEECRAKNIYSYLKTFRHKIGSETNPQIILDRGYGDCDEMSYLYMTMLKSEGISSRMQCNHNHCWTLVFPDNKRVFVDVVNSIWKEY